jgi:hypothetical protein
MYMEDDNIKIDHSILDTESWLTDEDIYNMFFEESIN